MKPSTQPVAIVTGASRGIGKAIALALVAEKYAVVGLYKSNAEAAALMVERGVDMQQADVGSEADVVAVFDHIKSTYGRIDVVVNNAGIDIYGPIENYAPADWHTMVATNITSVFLLSRYSIGYLKAAANPSITNISSRLGINEFAESDFVVYGAVKAAVNTFTVALAKELKNDNIRVNAVIPAPTKTDLFDKVFTAEDEAAFKAKGKLGSPEDVAKLVLELVKSTTTTGELVVDERVGL